MAKKRVLKEDNEQIWPISRVDCIYGIDGETLLSEDYASKRDIATDEEVNDVLNIIWII